MYDAGASLAEIARELHRDLSTIGRELRRNSLAGHYWAAMAQQMTRKRRRERPLVRKMERAEILNYVLDRLVQCWSPDQIGGRARADFPDDRRRLISHQTIYAWIARQSVERRQVVDDERE